MQKKLSIVIVGGTPPPIGGVSIHIQRVYEHSYNLDEFEISVFDLKKSTLQIKQKSTRNLLLILKELLFANVIHIHISHPSKLAFAILFKALRKKVIYTHHNSIVSNKLQFNFLYALCDTFIVVNGTVIKALYKSKKMQVIPAYLPPKLSSELRPDVLDFLSQQSQTISTNAFSLNFVDGKETYGIDILCSAINKILSENNDNKIDFGVVFFDPSDSYSNHALWNSLEKKYPLKVKRFTGDNLSFYELLKKTSICIRSTRTDGDPLSIREALGLGVTVIASDAAERPNEVLIYETENVNSLATLLKKELVENKKLKERQLPNQDLKNYHELLNVYRKYS